MGLLEDFEAEHTKALQGDRKNPDFAPGDTIRVMVRVREGSRSRLQAFEGVCIAKRSGGLHENFTVRKISHGVGVERVFPLHSPLVDSIKRIRRGRVRRAKLHYLRTRLGRAARIAEKRSTTATALSKTATALSKTTTASSTTASSKTATALRKTCVEQNHVEQNCI